MAQSASVSSNSSVVSNLGDQQVEQLKFFTDQDSQTVVSGKTYYIKDKKQFFLDYQTGVFSMLDNSTETYQNYCLSSDLLIQIKDIISGASVCKTEPILTEGTVCSQVIMPPYAEVVTSNDVIQLGYASDSCGSNAVDLCEDQSAKLKQWIQTVSNQLSQFQCSQL